MRTDPDYRLVAGFRFRCLPGCGLCCYTTPAVAPAERSRLIQLDPEVPLLEARGGWANVASRPEGGACYFLREGRCACHASRPATCAEFPLTAYVSDRVQVSVVLSCPGVELAPLLRLGEDSSAGALSGDLASEIETVNSEVARAEASGQLRSVAQRRRQVERRLSRAGLWQSEGEIRERIQGQLDHFIPSELTDDDSPDEESELEALPIFYEPSLGRVVWRRHPGGVEFLSIRESGGIAAHLEVLVPPTRSPPLADGARTMLRGYLQYLLDRDATIGVAYDRLLRGEPDSPELVVARDLQDTAGQVIRLATLRRALVSDRRGELLVQDLEDGIRATDMDILDRPTTGLRL